MLTSSLLGGFRAARASVVVTRNLAAAQKATDPIQQLFLDKIREYKQKSVPTTYCDSSDFHGSPNGDWGRLPILRFPVFLLCEPIDVHCWTKVSCMDKGGKLVDPSPEIEKELKTELEKLERQFGGGAGVDMTSFPSFKFEEPKLDPIDEQAAPAKK